MASGRRASTGSMLAFATMDEPGLEITRVFDAPREEVWREWTEPERFAGWYGGPEADNPLDTVSMDVRPGGEPGEDLPARRVGERGERECQLIRIHPLG